MREHVMAEKPNLRRWTVYCLDGFAIETVPSDERFKQMCGQTVTLASPDCEKMAGLTFHRTAGYTPCALDKAH